MSSSTYTASLEIHRLKKDGSLDEGAPKVCFKRDGQRFDCEYTMKLLVDTHYEFQVNIRPPLPLHSVSVQGSAVTVVDLSDPKQSGQGGGNTYSFKWDTIKAEPDKRKKRSVLLLRLEFQGNLSLTMPIQVKYYKLEDEEHLTWGSPLSRVDYECEQKPGLIALDIVKTLYR